IKHLAGLRFNQRSTRLVEQVPTLCKPNASSDLVLRIYCGKRVQQTRIQMSKVQRARQSCVNLLDACGGNSSPHTVCQINFLTFCIGVHIPILSTSPTRTSLLCSSCRPVILAFGSMQPAAGSLCCGPRLVPLDANLLFAASRTGDVVGILHSYEGVHIDTERLLEAQGHVAGEIGPGVQETGKGWAGDAKNPRRIGHRKVVCLDDLGSQKAARMNRV